MEVETWIATIGLVIGGGGIVGFIVGLLTIKYERKKAKGEAHSAEYEGMKVEQDTYQELIIDLKEAWKEQKDYIGELTTDRRNLRQERNDLRKDIEDLRAEFNREREKDEEEKTQMRKEIERLKSKLARQGRIIKVMSPLICTKDKCKTRASDIMGLIDDESFGTEEEEG